MTSVDNRHIIYVPNMTTFRMTNLTGVLTKINISSILSRIFSLTFALSYSPTQTEIAFVCLAVPNLIIRKLMTNRRR